MRKLLHGLGSDLAGFFEAIRRTASFQPGLHTYRLRPPGGTRRIHLRIQADGTGLLMVDVTDVVHLNPTATCMAKLALDKVPRTRAVRALRSAYRGTRTSRLGHEVTAIYDLVENLSATSDSCPTCGLAKLGRSPLFSMPVRAPYKADLALTYGCNNACRHCYNERQRAGMSSLRLDDWQKVIKRLAGVGIPHVIFTGGEPTLLPGLAELICFAERLGLVTGLNTNGRRLSDPGWVWKLADAGLSHVQITLASHRPEVHDAITAAGSFWETVAGIRGSIEAGLHTITNTTLTRRNADHADEIVDYLHELGLRTIAMNGMIYSGSGRGSGDAISEEEMAPVLVRVRDRAEDLGMRLLWYTPTAYCRLSPVELELGPRRCNAGEYSICVEPNGDVLPCQSFYTPVGNILRDDWQSIWHSPLFHSFRDRVADPRACGLPKRCWDCPDLPLCAGGCRIERDR
jgi:radical SAM protein with 4Fe4S-binding SPASM domain